MINANLVVSNVNNKLKHAFNRIAHLFIERISLFVVV